jgi:hypothetical protein
MRRLATHRDRAPRTRVPAYNSLSLRVYYTSIVGGWNIKSLIGRALLDAELSSFASSTIHPAIEIQYAGV